MRGILVTIDQAAYFFKMTIAIAISKRFYLISTNTTKTYLQSDKIVKDKYTKNLFKPLDYGKTGYSNHKTAM